MVWQHSVMQPYLNTFPIETCSANVSAEPLATMPRYFSSLQIESYSCLITLTPFKLKVLCQMRCLKYLSLDSKWSHLNNESQIQKRALPPPLETGTRKISKSGKATCDVKKDIPRFGPYGKDFCNLGITVYIQSLQERELKKKRKWTVNHEHWLMIHTCNLNKATHFLEEKYSSDERVSLIIILN